MVTKGRLRQALANDKGIDFQKLKEKKKAKANLKAKQAILASRTTAETSSVEDEGDADAGESSEEAQGSLDLLGINDSDSSESSIEFEARIQRKRVKTSSGSPAKATEALRIDTNHENQVSDIYGNAQDMAEAEEEEQEDVPVSDLEDLDEVDKEDLVLHTRLTINNTTALLASLSRIALATNNAVPFSTHQCVVASSDIASSVPDVQDDLQRELAFYSQSLDAVRTARSRLIAEGIPFSRPKDYFAEMVKEDAHMDKVKAKLIEEASAKKAATEARKQRDLKKFGKQVQVAKLQERQKAKRETLDKIKSLKRKRQESGTESSTKEADLFDVAVEKETGNSSSGFRSGPGRNNAVRTNSKRLQKNEKYGFGGKKRHVKSGDAMSSGDLSGFNAKRMKAGGRVSKRPGKARRKALASK